MLRWLCTVAVALVAIGLFHKAVQWIDGPAPIVEAQYLRVALRGPVLEWQDGKAVVVGLPKPVATPEAPAKAICNWAHSEGCGAPQVTSWNEGVEYIYGYGTAFTHGRFRRAYSTFPATLDSHHRPA